METRRHLNLNVKLFVIALLMVFGVFGSTLSQPETALAGVNGQQVQFTCPALAYVKIQGTNQRGEWVVWQGRPSDGWSVVTWNWWFKGSVLIEYQQTNGRATYWSSQWSWVPTVWYQNGYRINCSHPVIR